MVDKFKLLSLATLVLAGIITLMTALSLRDQHKASTPLTDLPDAFMEEVNALVFDKQGKPKMKIITPKMIHFAKNDKTQLTTPELTIYRKSLMPWYVTSKYAEAINGTDKVHFRDDVIVQHAADENQPATVIKTATLIVTPDTQLADTEEAITMMQPNLMIKGVGMHADMSSGDIKLLSQTRGEYVPNS